GRERAGGEGPGRRRTRRRATRRVSSREHAMIQTIAEILSPTFLLRDALIGSVLVGLVCPLVGVYFVLRRMIFLGVALPQVSAAGIACSFLGYRLIMGPHEHGEGGERLIALVGSISFTLLALLFLAALERRAKQSVEI